MKRTRVKVNAHVVSVGFYSYIVRMVIPNTSET